MTKHGSSAGLILCAVLTSCAGITDDVGEMSRVDPHTMAASNADNREAVSSGCGLVTPIGDKNPGSINLDCYTFPGDTKKAYPEAADEKGNYARNRLASVLIKQSDDICALELGRMVGKQAVTNTGLSIATSALSAAGSIVTGNLAHSILAGGASVTNSSRDSINAEIYHNEVMQAITQAIENQRSSMRAKIVANYGLTNAQWSIDDAVRDINEYHQQCSFYRGLELVVTAVSKPQATPPTPDTSALNARIKSLSLEASYWRARALLLSTSDKSEQAKLRSDRDAFDSEMTKELISSASQPTGTSSGVKTTGATSSTAVPAGSLDTSTPTAPTPPTPPASATSPAASPSK